MTQADLDALVVDLPAPAPHRDSVALASRVRGAIEGWRDTVMALTPFAALALFFTTGHHWMWFLVIPVMGIMLYGPGGQSKAGQGKGGS